MKWFVFFIYKDSNVYSILWFAQTRHVLSIPSSITNMLFFVEWLFVGDFSRQHNYCRETINKVKIGIVRFFQWNCNYIMCEASQLDKTKGLLFEWRPKDIGIRICGEQEPCTSTLGYAWILILPPSCFFVELYMLILERFVHVHWDQYFDQYFSSSMLGTQYCVGN